MAYVFNHLPWLVIHAKGSTKLARVVIDVIDIVFIDLQFALLDQFIDILRMMQNFNAFKLILLYKNLIANRAGKHETRGT